jgi:hypothetical protein
MGLDLAVPCIENQLLGLFSGADRRRSLMYIRRQGDSHHAGSASGNPSPQAAANAASG